MLSTAPLVLMQSLLHALPVVHRVEGGLGSDWSVDSPHNTGIYLVDTALSKGMRHTSLKSDTNTHTHTQTRQTD